MTNNEIKAIVKAAGGSTLTREGRSANLHATAADLKMVLNIQIKSFSGLKTQHLVSLVSLWKQQGKSVRTIQNKLSHVRAALRCLERQKFADSAQVSNASLGASGSSRGGTHVVSSQETLQAHLSALSREFQAAAQLQQKIGLRAQEAIQAGPSLRLWQKQLQKGQRISVLHGTKGGRPREVRLPTEQALAEALGAVRNAIAVLDKGTEHLITSSSLRGANRAYQRAMQSAGFKGAEASHSLRYHFAQAQFERYIDLGFDRKEALSALSLDLGHGDGRGRYCAQVYLMGQEDCG